MAGALQLLLLRGVVNGAGKVSAFLAVGNVLLRSRAHQDALVLGCGIKKQLYSPYWYLIRSRNGGCRVRGPAREPGTHQDPQIAHEHAQTGQHQEFGELAPAHVALVVAEDRELIPPQRFRARPAKRTHLLPPTCSPLHQWKQNSAP